MAEHLLITPFGYYLRVSVPKDLRARLGKREIKKSLSTYNRTHAIKVAQLLMLGIEQLFSSMRGVSMTWRKKPVLPGMSEIIVRDLIDRHGRPYQEREMTVEEHMLLYPGHRQIASSPPVIPDLRQSPPVAAEPPQQLTLQGRIISYCAEKKGKGELTFDSHQNLRTILDLLIDYFGDVAMSTISRDEAAKFIGVLRQTPLLRKHTKIYRDLSLSECVPITEKRVNEMLKLQKLGKECEEIKFPKISTLNSYITQFEALWEWCFTQDRTLTNPFADQQLSTVDDAAPRLPFTTAQLDTIFHDEMFTQHHTPHKSLRSRFEPHQFFTPLIAAYSGLRLDEICQLHLDDIECPHGVWVFNINTKLEKKLKNKASVRSVPIHPVLIDLGLFEYMQELRSEGEIRLFPELVRTPRKKGGFNRYSLRVSPWFSKFLNRINLTSESLVFHSFRHTFSNSYKQTQYDEIVVGELLGHAHAKETFGTYSVAHQHEILKIGIDNLKLGVLPSCVEQWTASFVKPWTVGTLPQAAVIRRMRREAKDPFLVITTEALKSATQRYAAEKRKT